MFNPFAGISKIFLGVAAGLLILTSGWALVERYRVNSRDVTIAELRVDAHKKEIQISNLTSAVAVKELQLDNLRRSNKIALERDRKNQQQRLLLQKEIGVILNANPTQDGQVAPVLRNYIERNRVRYKEENNHPDSSGSNDG